MKLDDRVIYVGKMERYHNKHGRITEANPSYPSSCIVTFDHEPGRGRVIDYVNLRLETTTMNIKQNVKDAINGLFPKIGTDLDAVAKELLVAQNASSVAEARKKKAKAAALAAGLVLDEYRPGEERVYESDAFVVTAKTKEPSSRLDPALLDGALVAAGLSRSKITAAIAKATVANKPATSFEVEQR